MRRLFLLAFLSLGVGCVTAAPLETGESFHIDISAQGTGERTVVLDVTPNFGSPLGAGVAMSDLTTLDDDVNAERRIRIDGLRPQNSNSKRASPSSGRIAVRTFASRPTRLVLEYKGHTDVYHLSFPADGGVLVEPSQGEFSSVYVKER
jgi:hypothetical protein